VVFPQFGHEASAVAGRELIGPAGHFERPDLDVERKAFSRTQPVTTQSDRHFFEPIWFVPLKRAPGAGPLDPRLHSAPIVSGDQSPMRVMSAMSSHAASGVVAIGRFLKRLCLDAGLPRIRDPAARLDPVSAKPRRPLGPPRSTPPPPASRPPRSGRECRRPARLLVEGDRLLGRPATRSTRAAQRRRWYRRPRRGSAGHLLGP
jgi:hypothetical protein